MAEAADLKKYGHYTRSPEALYYPMQMSRIASAFAFQPSQRLKSYFPDVDLSPESRLTKDTTLFGTYASLTGRIRWWD